MTFVHCYLPANKARCYWGALHKFKAAYPHVKEFGALRQAASGAWYTMGMVANV